MLNIQQQQLVESNDPYVTTSDMNYRCTGVCVNTVFIEKITLKFPDFQGAIKNKMK